MKHIIRELIHSIMAMAFIVCVLFGAALLTGCAPAKIIYDACMDGNCR